MWNYHTLQEAVKEGVRFEAVRGADLLNNSLVCSGNPDSCGRIGEWYCDGAFRRRDRYSAAILERDAHRWNQLPHLRACQ